MREAAELGALGEASGVPGLWSTWYLACIQRTVNMARDTPGCGGAHALVVISTAKHTHASTTAQVGHCGQEGLAPAGGGPDPVVKHHAG